MDKQERIAEVMFGSFQSYFVPKIHDMLINLNEEKIKDLIRNAISKSPEGLLYQLIQESDNVVEKNRDILENKGNIVYYNLINNFQRN